MNTIIIRQYEPSDLQEIIVLFKEAVANINIKHYSQAQIDVWTDVNLERWENSLQENVTFVACIGSKIVGFADMTHEGYLDRLYIHKDHRGGFVSLRLFRAIEKSARELGLAAISTDCSITARIPAERMGFRVIREQKVERKGMTFINYHMVKKLL